MAWSITSLANYNEGNGSGDTLSKTTGTLSIPANSVILVFAQACIGSGAWTGNPIVVSDSVNGTSGWTGLDSQVNLGDTFGIAGGRLFYRSFTSSASPTITVSRTSGTGFWGYSVLAVTGQDTANPIVQTKGVGTFWNDGGDTHTQSTTFATNPTSGNAVISFLGANNDNIGAATTPSTYTSLDAPSPIFMATATAYHTSTTGATVTWPDCGQGIESAIEFTVELLAAGGGGGGGNSGSIAWITG